MWDFKLDEILTISEKLYRQTTTVYLTVFVLLSLHLSLSDKNLVEVHSVLDVF